MEFQEKDNKSPFVFVLNHTNGDPILAAQMSTSDNKINLNQENLMSIPRILGNSLELIASLKTIFEEKTKKIVLSVCKTDFGTAILLNDSESYDFLPVQFITDTSNSHYFNEGFEIDSGLSKNLEQKILEIITSTKNLKVKPLNNSLLKMHEALKKYFSFVSVFNNNGESVTSTLDLSVEQNRFAKQVFDTIAENETINDILIDMEKNLFYKQLGDVIVFYFYLNGLYFYFFSINPKVNIGITKLKLLSYIKSNIDEIKSNITQMINSVNSGRVKGENTENSHIKIEKITITIEFD
ncbi:MAG: hypothetical protein ACW967_01210 [Candidatus Hodarchaeales archaeon]|jgi:hypothetical protein